jgi:glucan phosphoethanolaminetransferase (alkaline phosphatase superfamily)
MGSPNPPYQETDMSSYGYYLCGGLFVVYYWNLLIKTKENLMRKISIAMFLFSLLVIPLHYSSAIYQNSVLSTLLSKPKVSSSWTPLKPIVLDQSHLNPYAPLGSIYNQMYTRSANDFSGWTNTKAPLGSQFNPIYIGNSSTRYYSSSLFNTARIGTQFNPLYLAPVTGY